ncbi:MAG: hypothetical protein Ta2E_10080 [Mycoplasmoidaceae bacterium]|nr:MAG: hypothetical protein Ta2E_10080 [Mycoplasmoidaceae bacterium]
MHRKKESVPDILILIEICNAESYQNDKDPNRIVITKVNDVKKLINKNKSFKSLNYLSIKFWKIAEYFSCSIKNICKSSKI